MPINQRMGGHGLMSQWYAAIEIAKVPNPISTILTPAGIGNGTTVIASSSKGTWCTM